MALRLLSYLRTSALAFPLAALAALAMFAISESSYQRATGALDELGDRATARSHLNTIAKALLDAESAQRGYLITNRAGYLEPYRSASAEMAASLGWLRTYAGRAPSQVQTAQTVQALSVAIEDKLAELQDTIRTHDAGNGDGWRALVLADAGKSRMQKVRTLTERLLTDEAERVAAGRRDVYRTLMINRIGVTAMAALSLLALFMYLRQSAALDHATGVENRRAATERHRLEEVVAARTEELRELARHLQTVREDERSMLARELHDELGALLTAAKLDAARLKSRLAQAHPEALERLQHLNDTLNGGIALKRRIIEDLRPSSLSNLGLVAALEILLREFAERSEIEIVDRLDAVVLPDPLQLTVYRLVQEALTNIAKYARASRVDVTLGDDGAGRVKVTVRDDGIGFDPKATPVSTHGLIGMRFRVEAEGGTMRIESAPGKGTLIEALLPPTPESARRRVSSAASAPPTS